MIITDVVRKWMVKSGVFHPHIISINFRCNNCNRAIIYDSSNHDIHKELRIGCKVCCKEKTIIPSMWFRT